MASALYGSRLLNNNISTLFCLGQVSLRPPEDCFWSIQHCLAQNTISKGYLLYIIDKKSYNFFKKKERWRPENFTSERKFILSILRVCRTVPHWWLKYLLEVYLNWRQIELKHTQKRGKTTGVYLLKDFSGKKGFADSKDQEQTTASVVTRTAPQRSLYPVFVLVIVKKQNRDYDWFDDIQDIHVQELPLGVR